MDIVIFGTGGLGREIHQIVEDSERDTRKHNFLGFLDENSTMHGHQVHGFPVLGGFEWLSGRGGTEVIVGVGNPVAKRYITERIASMGLRLASAIHPTAFIGNRVDFGEGLVAQPGAVVTTDISMGRCVLLGGNSVVGHDVILGDFVTLAPGAKISGNVNIGEGCDIGTNGCVIQGMKIGAWTVLGAGAVVNKDIPSNVTAVGIPAKPIKERPEGWHLEQVR